MPLLACGRAPRLAEVNERFRRDQHLAGRRDEAGKFAARRRRIADFARQGHRFDAEQTEAAAADLDAAFHDR